MLKELIFMGVSRLTFNFGNDVPLRLNNLKIIFDHFSTKQMTICDILKPVSKHIFQYFDVFRKDFGFGHELN